MDDREYGSFDKRGHWLPFKRVKYPPLFTWPAKPLALVKWIFGYPGYILPWNVIYALVAVVVWLFLTPPLSTMETFEPGWILFVLVRNAALLTIGFGGFHFALYMKKTQGRLFKYNPKWQATDNPSFLFRNQTVDNLIWCFFSGLPIWTTYEVITLWMIANGHIPYLNFNEHPVAFFLIMLLVPLMREFHFYCIHRLIHWPPLYRAVHKVHHANVNPGPWSGLSMHPVEHLFYFSGVLIHWIIPSHPIHAMYHILHAALSPAPGHTGFDRIVVSDNDAVEVHGLAHYLHHKYFEVNYADGAIPLDKWFGTFHDGSDEAQTAMKQRLRLRAQRLRG